MSLIDDVFRRAGIPRGEFRTTERQPSYPGSDARARGTGVQYRQPTGTEAREAVAEGWYPLGVTSESIDSPDNNEERRQYQRARYLNEGYRAFEPTFMDPGGSAMQRSPMGPMAPGGMPGGMPGMGGGGVMPWGQAFGQAGMSNPLSVGGALSGIDGFFTDDADKGLLRAQLLSMLLGTGLSIKGAHDEGEERDEEREREERELNRRRAATGNVIDALGRYGS